MTQLQMLLADGIIEEVLGQLKSGKEAEVWLVRHGGETVAAKIYKERDFRSFKNNAEYKEGRQVRNTRTQRAMDKGSRFGQQAAEEAWKAAEATALSQLHAAGVRVPKPVMFYEGVLLMEVVIDAEGHVAPRLVDAAIPPEAAAGLYQALRGQAVKMLCADLIHGDLSEFNVLLAHDGPMLIDLPQVISAAQNSRSEHFFKRDIDNLRRFFAQLDPAIGQRHSDGDEIWRAYVRRELTHDFEPTGRMGSPPPAQGRGPQQAQGRGQQQAQGRGPQPPQQPGRRNDRNRPRGRGEGAPGPAAARPAGPEVSYRGAPPQRPSIPGAQSAQSQPPSQPRPSQPGKPAGHRHRRRRR